MLGLEVGERPIGQATLFEFPVRTLLGRTAKRRTLRCTATLRLLALALGGRAGVRLGRKLALAGSRDTLLRRVRAAFPHSARGEVVRVLGVDDWAWRKGQRYGTMLVHLERRRVVDLLPDRDADTLARWLQDPPEV